MNTILTKLQENCSSYEEFSEKILQDFVRSIDKEVNYATFALISNFIYQRYGVRSNVWKD